MNELDAKPMKTWLYSRHTSSNVMLTANKGSLVLAQFTIDEHYHCDFVVRDIKRAVYVELSRKINFNFVREFLNK